MGVSEVRINKSARFREGKEDSLRPVNPEWIGLRSKNQSVIKRALKTSDQPFIEKSVQIRPQCQTAQEVFIDYRGNVFPCCACAMYGTSRYANWFAGLGDQISLEHHDLQEVLGNPVWQGLQELWRTPEKCPASCIKRCGVVDTYQQELPPDQYIAKPDSDNQKIKFS
jgi:hypothetical protein